MKKSSNALFWAHRPDRDIFDVGPFPSREDAVDESPALMGLATGQRFEVGQCEPFKPTLPNAVDLLNLAATDKMKWSSARHPHAWKWIERLPKGEAAAELNAAIALVVDGWLSKHELVPRFGYMLSETITIHYVGGEPTKPAIGADESAAMDHVFTTHGETLKKLAEHDAGQASASETAPNAPRQVPQSGDTSGLIARVRELQGKRYSLNKNEQWNVQDELASASQRLANRCEQLERELSDAKQYGAGKDHTATGFMNQVRKLQAELSAERQKREDAERERDEKNKAWRCLGKALLRCEELAGTSAGGLLEELYAAITKLRTERDSALRQVAELKAEIARIQDSEIAELRAALASMQGGKQ